MDDKKTVLITGSTRGIGLALAALYKEQGWKVIGAARNLDAADKLEALEPYKIVQLDASDEPSILRAAAELQGEPIDLLVNSAGIGTNESIDTATKESILKQLEVNERGRPIPRDAGVHAPSARGGGQARLGDCGADVVEHWQHDDARRRRALRLPRVQGGTEHDQCDAQPRPEGRQDHRQ